MKIICFTSMNKPYYDRIGKLMIETFSKFWPEDCELIVYQEGFEIENFDRVTGVSWEENCLENWNKFAKKTKGPAVIFAKKGYTMIAGMKNIDCDLLIWVDADVITNKKFPKDKIESILPQNKLIALFDTYYQIKPNHTKEEYLDTNRPYSAAESGFVIINKNHQHFKDYLAEYERLYNNEIPLPGVFEWYDGNVCSTAAYGFREYIEDLSLLRTTDKSQTPINRSWIREYCYHAKAKQKDGLDIKQIRNDLGI
jgi:hypothetical protein